MPWINGMFYSEQDMQDVANASPEGQAQRQRSQFNRDRSMMGQHWKSQGQYAQTPQRQSSRTRELPRAGRGRGRWNDDEGMSWTHRDLPGAGQTVMPTEWGQSGSFGLPASGSRLPSGLERGSLSFTDRYFGGYGGNTGNQAPHYFSSRKYGGNQVGNARSRSRSLGDDEIDADLRFSPGRKTGGFFGGGKGLGLNKETFDLGMAAYGLYGDIQDRSAAGRAEDRAIKESARIGKYAATNLSNKAQMVNFKYDQLRDWMDVNDPNRERYTRPTNVATSIEV